jgi:Fur family transcriptional regulator, peroxide stress response regulator
MEHTTEIKDRNSLFIETLSRAGLRLTPQRLAVCKQIAQSEEHPTAQMIYAALQPHFPSLSLATVYNTLDTLVELGVVNVLGSFGDGVEHYDGDTRPHVNLACLACSRVIDLPSRNVYGLEQEVIDSSGYEIKGARVLYYGICPQCQKKD